MDRLKDKELDDWYQQMFDLTAHKGWDNLMEQVDTLRKGYADVRTCRTDAERSFRQGQLDILDWLAGMAQTTRDAYDQMIEQEAEEDNDASL